MKENITAIRAITAEYARQFVRPFLWITFGILITLLISTGVLAYLVSPWWLLLLVPLLLISIAFTIAGLLVRLILKTWSPKLNAQQQHSTKEFVTKLQFATETIQTPYPVIIFYVLRDIVMRRDNGFISELTRQSKMLHPDFEDLKKLF